MTMKQATQEREKYLLLKYLLLKSIPKDYLFKVHLEKE